jgi:ATP-dependent Clp protease adaptor protein ClpS
MMSPSLTKPRTLPKTKTQRPKLWKVILLNDDYTPRDFVVTVLKAVFRMTSAQANGVMLTAHRRGVCVVAVYTREIAETKAREATDMGKREGYPLTFTTQPED